MIELVVLVAAVGLLAVVLRPVLEWLWLREWKATMAHLERLRELERQRELQARLYSEFSMRQPWAHAVITGITS